MNDDFNTALLLLAVGMITVFSILAFIVLLGGWLIKIVNKCSPDANGTKSSTPPGTSSVESKKLAAIISAVDTVTKGKGKVVSAKRSQ